MGTPFAFEEEWFRRGRYRELHQRVARALLSEATATRVRARSPGRSGTRPPASSPAPRESVLKVLSWGKSRGAARRMLDYVARAHEEDIAAKPALRDELGLPVTLVEARRRLGGQGQSASPALDRGDTAGDGFASDVLASDDLDWQLLDDEQNLSPAARLLSPGDLADLPEAERYRRRQVVHLSFSIGGPEAPQERLALEAGTARAVQRSFGAAGFPVVWTIHDDHGRSHAHLIVGTRTRADGAGRQGERATLRLGPDALAELRHRFTEEVAALGVDVVATSRKERAAERARLLQGQLESAAGPTMPKGADRSRGPRRLGDRPAWAAGPRTGVRLEATGIGHGGPADLRNRAPVFVETYSTTLNQERQVLLALKAEAAAEASPVPGGLPGRGGFIRTSPHRRIGGGKEDPLMLAFSHHAEGEEARQRYTELETELAVNEGSGRLADWYLVNRPEIFGPVVARPGPSQRKRLARALEDRRRGLEGPRRAPHIPEVEIPPATSPKTEPANRRIREQGDLAGRIFFQLGLVQTAGRKLLAAVDRTLRVLDDDPDRSLGRRLTNFAEPLADTLLERRRTLGRLALAELGKYADVLRLTEAGGRIAEAWAGLETGRPGVQDGVQDGGRGAEEAFVPRPDEIETETPSKVTDRSQGAGQSRRGRTGRDRS